MNTPTPTPTEEHRMKKIKYVWVAAIADGEDITVTLHKTEAEGYEALRANWLDWEEDTVPPGASVDDIIEALDEQELQYSVTQEKLP